MNIKKWTNDIRKGVVLILTMVCLGGVFPGSAHAAEVRVTTTETVETGTNERGWTWGVGTDYLVESNGNRGYTCANPTL
jgi:hypothetical protein